MPCRDGRYQGTLPTARDKMSGMGRIVLLAAVHTDAVAAEKVESFPQRVFAFPIALS
jgi:hypothetical protein